MAKVEARLGRLEEAVSELTEAVQGTLTLLKRANESRSHARSYL